MFKLMGKEIITILRSKSLLNWSNEICHVDGMILYYILFVCLDDVRGTMMPI